MIIFISGPITGVMNYREKFEAAVRYLEERGHIAINPAMLPAGIEKPGAYINICKAMVRESDGIYMLTGWENCIRATREYEEAVKNALCVFRQGDEDWTHIEDQKPRDNSDVEVMLSSSEMNAIVKAEYIYDELNGTTYFANIKGEIENVIKWRYV